MAFIGYSLMFFGIETFFIKCAVELFGASVSTLGSWYQYGPPLQLPNIKNPKAYAKGLGEAG